MAALKYHSGYSPDPEKSKKYDRQLRLWGDHGQGALEGTHVCLINATATGTEVLKSIVLPGIGAFTIVDGNKVTGEDIGNNFFFDSESIGKPRAQIATQLLLEMNSDVRGDFVDETPEHLLEENSEFFNSFSVVVATGLAEKTLLLLSSLLWEAGVPLLVCRAYGMIGYMRLQVSEHTVIETHPDNVLDDLRLDRPFPALQEYVDSLNLDQMDLKDHSHTPYVALLLKYIQQWQKENNGEVPRTFNEKKAFKEMIRKGIRINEEGVPDEEENYEEAIKAVNTALNATLVPVNVQNILNDTACENLSSESKPFWIMARALRDFVENEGKGALPVRGTIPDMTADSERYIKLQNVYRAQATKDVNAISNRVQKLLLDLGKPQDLITEMDIKLFCKNTHNLQVVRGRSLAQEYNPKTMKFQDIVMHLNNPDSEMVFYVMLRAVDRFYTEFNRFPGYFDDQVEPDIIKLKTCLCRILQEWGCAPLAKDDYVHEMCRYGAAELHSVAAFIGGTGAQEVIKLITGQYVPFNNTFLYNAMTATSATFEL